MEKEAQYYINLSSDLIQCHLCPHHCFVLDGATGKCRTRYHKKGKLYAKNYGVIAGMTMVPMAEHFSNYKKKSQVFSLGTYGCNMSCRFCATHRWSQCRMRGDVFPVQNIVERAKGLVDQGNEGILFGYSEPVNWFEFVLEAAIMAQGEGLKTFIETNGFANPEPFEALLDVMDGVHIGLKGFNELFYYEWCGGHYKPVLDNIVLAAKRPKLHLEVSLVVIPEHNDRYEDVVALAKWLAELSPTITLNLIPFKPHYLVKEMAPTDLVILYDLQKAAEEYLPTVNRFSIVD